MNISGYNQPEPCYGIGVEELCRRWIDLEIAQLAAGMPDAARATKMMRRQLQEAANLVADPTKLIVPSNALELSVAAEISRKASAIAGALWDDRDKAGTLAEQLRAVANEPSHGTDGDLTEEDRAELLKLADASEAE